ncbi:unnamed protein product, partial [Closterium sp. NIES-54]
IPSHHEHHPSHPIPHGPPRVPMAAGYNGNPKGYNLPKGTDLFVSVRFLSHTPL